jgi:heme-degrading monooxygenase HmoA
MARAPRSTCRTPQAIVSINVMYPLKGSEDKALAVLREVVERARSRHSGLVRTRVYKSLDGRTLATHAEWKSKAQFDAVLRDDEFVRRFNQARELGIWESHVYEVTDDICRVQRADQSSVCIAEQRCTQGVAR